MYLVLKRYFTKVALALFFLRCLRLQTLQEARTILLPPILYSAFARSPHSLPLTLFFRSFRSAICNPERSHWMGMPRITNGERENGVWGRERGDRANTE